jgi:hypothetical protein
VKADTVHIGPLRAVFAMARAIRPGRRRKGVKTGKRRAAHAFASRPASRRCRSRNDLPRNRSSGAALRRLSRERSRRPGHSGRQARPTDRRRAAWRASTVQRGTLLSADALTWRLRRDAVSAPHGVQLDGGPGDDPACISSKEQADPQAPRHPPPPPPAPRPDRAEPRVVWPAFCTLFAGRSGGRSWIFQPRLAAAHRLRPRPRLH